MDIFHLWGNDIGAGSSGDLATVDGTVRNQQRILRRLLTNPQAINADGSITPGDYAQHPDYGAGLPQYVGDLYDPSKIRARIRGQMLMESCVARTPEPQIDVQQVDQGISCNIQYVDSTTNTPQVLSFNVTQ
ncbi:hypothetical protein [Sideroxydans lithotrophicus]|uniref:Putative phage tail protein n=1 Tax=Sideroxydans lithotrophicus (strain ES-1) TaxID=580332 RepID=D5CT42_SIDLE|nr:hypothetical protein [Sideroxydans lithotrophicus]ADE12128.1 putative phage tail protein [Sideroxydans lithotrophicus ES-1]